jgi:hypothetical protein
MSTLIRGGPQTTFARQMCSGALLPPPSPPAEKATDSPEDAGCGDNEYMP